MRIESRNVSGNSNYQFACTWESSRELLVEIKLPICLYISSEFIHLERQRFLANSRTNITSTVILRNVLAKTRKNNSRTKLVTKMQAFVPHLYLTTHWNHMWPSYEKTYKDNDWSVMENMPDWKICPTPLSEGSNCPIGTSGVLLLLILYCQHITILNAYKNISFVLNEVRDLFL